MNAAVIQALGRARLVVPLLALGAALGLVAIGSQLLEIDLLSRIASGGAFTDADLEASDQRQALIAVVQIGLAIVTAFAFLFWLHAARRALRDTGVPGLRFTPGWSIGWFFVPIANLWRPYQVMQETWRASAALSSTDERATWQQRPGLGLIGVWWAALLIEGPLGRVLLQSNLRSETPQQMIDAGRLTVVADALGIATAILALLVVRAVDARYRTAVAPAEMRPSLP